VRRFFNTRPGRLICHLLALALALPSFAWLSISGAQAQIQAQQRWAVIDFSSRRAMPEGVAFGTEAAQRVYDELAKTGRYDLEPPDTVRRTVEQLGLQTPVTEQTSLLRLAQEMRVATLVTGEVVGWGVRQVNGGKQAVVAVRVLVLDVASGLPVNGAAEEAMSTVRPPTTADDVLISEALGQAAAQAVQRIRMQTLPQATVLNTREQTALINRGAREGFRQNQTVVVLRGREQVATARVTDVLPDSATIRVERQTRGIQPQDRVRVVFQVPDIVARPGGQVTETGDVRFAEVRPRRGIDMGAIVTVGVVILLAAVLFGGGRGAGDTGANNVTAEATLFPTGAGNPAVLIRWRLDAFHRGPNNIQWLIFRNDVTQTPALVADGQATRVYDRPGANTFQYAQQPDAGSLACVGLNMSPTVTTPPIVPGQPYLYEVALVYRVNVLDMPGTATGGAAGATGGVGGATGGPGGATGGPGGPTGGATGGPTTITGGSGGFGSGEEYFEVPQTTTTGGVTTATTGAGDFCYFVTGRAAAQGPATPLPRPVLETPQQNETVIDYRNFTFQSVVNPLFPIRIGYVLQLSSSPTFPRDRTFTTPERVSGGLGTQSIQIPREEPTFQQFLQRRFGDAQQIWWRVGARNIEDNPGPEPDQFTGMRYIFSAPQPFTRPIAPPGLE
jgi:hypothetical protein